jgi:hypothetical protein
MVVVSTVFYLYRLQVHQSKQLQLHNNRLNFSFVLSPLHTVAAAAATV